MVRRGEMQFKNLPIDKEMSIGMGAQWLKTASCGHEAMPLLHSTGQATPLELIDFPSIQYP